MLSIHAFLAAYETACPRPALDMPRAAGLRSLLERLRADDGLRQAATEACEGLPDTSAEDLLLRWWAYMLATTKHEVGDTWEPIAERGDVLYLLKYESTTKIGQALGNTLVGDGQRFKGRGYCQITGRGNYAQFSKLLGVNLVGNPELALQPETAYQIMSRGMRDGLFTGKNLLRYIHPAGCDYVAARRIINGQDKAVEIAAYAKTIERCLRIATEERFRASAS